MLDRLIVNIKQLLKPIYHKVRMMIFIMIRRAVIKNQYNYDYIILIVLKSSVTDKQVNEIKKRCQFYVPNLKIQVLELEIKDKLPWDIMFGQMPLLLLDKEKIMPKWIILCRQGTFNIDYLQNPLDGQEWHDLLNYLAEDNEDYLLESQNRFIERILTLQQQSFDKCYIFGTGPSLAKAIDRDWADGYRIVCNTIVRDRELWHHIKPHFIVAGDSIYHFGHTDFAKTFRKDLRARLSESDTMFVYPSSFHRLVKQEFRELSDRLIPISKGKNNKINVNLIQDFHLAGLGNVLGLLLLPLSCTLSKNVYLWGFDGRAPDDKLFWSNSNKHSYPELMSTLQTAHPAFYEHFIDQRDPQKYVKSVHGDVLEQKMSDAESEGWKFVMMHKSYTPTLQKRCVLDISIL